MSEDDLIKRVSARGKVEYFTRELVRHRIDGPAIIAINGSKYWIQYGKYHRLDGPAWDLVSGKQMWYKRGRLHREDGPAVIKPGWNISYYIDNHLHREDGPASIYADGRQFWYYNGKLLSVKAYWEKVKDGPNATKVMAHILGSKQND